MSCMRWLATVSALALLLPPVLAQAPARSRADCESTYKPNVGQQGKDVVWVPTPDDVVERMLDMAEVKAGDTVIDLGAGDGKIAIAAGKRGATAIGVEYNPEMVKLAQCMVRVEGVGDRTRIVEGDIFKIDFDEADVVTMYLLPSLNRCVRHRILDMAPGTRVASHQFDMGDWEADEKDDVDGRSVYLWIVPARVGGNWALREDDGPFRLAVTFDQVFQKVTGEARIGGRAARLSDVSLRGRDLAFSFKDPDGGTRTFTGALQDDRLSGTLSGNGREIAVSGTQQGDAVAGAWAEMEPECASYYAQTKTATGR